MSRSLRTRTLEEAIYSMGHESGESIKSVASELGVSESYLYRMLSAFDGGAHFSPALLVRAMRFFNSVEPLRWMAQAMGFLLVRPPRGSASRVRLLSDLQVGFGRVIECLANGQESGSAHEKESAQAWLAQSKVLWGHMEDTAHVRAAVMKRMGQMELGI